MYLYIVYNKGFVYTASIKAVAIPIDLAGPNSLLMSGIELLQKRYGHFDETMSW